MKCECGGNRFWAHQVQYHNVMVNDYNEYQAEISCYETDEPHGPYICIKCKKQYENLEDFK